MSGDPGRGLYVDSPSNPVVRAFRKLRDAPGRRARGAFLLEGIRLVSEALAADWPIETALYERDRAAEDAALRVLVEHIRGAIPASRRAIEHAADTVNPQGIVAAAQLPRARVSIPDGERLVLVLDGVADPGNAGTLLRSALAAGLRTVLASRGSVDLFSPKVVRSAMGAHFHLALGQELSWNRIRDRLGPDRVIVLAEAGADTRYYEYDWLRPSALVVGSEARGAGEAAAKAAGHRVCVPAGPRVESLNAAVAGSVILFEARRQWDTGGEVAR